MNDMDVLAWLSPDVLSLLDVGCNAGELLTDIRAVYPTMRLAGVDVNAKEVALAAARLPDVEFHSASGDALPFPAASFDCVTCIETLEHIPAARRKATIAEIRRVLRPGGQFMLRVPHAGAFAWLDSNNLRFRFPRLYGATVRRGRRDAGYAHGSADVVWHHHFTKDEILALAGDGWRLEGERTGGLFLLPLTDIACWPFYRLRRTDNPVFRWLQRVARYDIGHSYGRFSFDILVVLRRE